jgi:hypothetical protein
MSNSPNWPFPPPGGPVPWTKKQIEEYKRRQREKEEDALL